MSIRGEAFLNFITYFGPRLTSLGVFAWIVPVALHSLGQARYAVLMTVLLVVGLVPLLDTGISYALTFRYTRALRRDRRAGALLLKEHRRIYLLVSLAAAGFFWGAFPWIFKSAKGQLGDDFTITMEAGAAAVFFMLLSGYNRAVLVANGKSYLVNLSDFAGDLLRGIAVGIGAAWYRDLGVTLTLIAAAFAIRWLLMAAITARRVRGHVTAAAGRIRRRSLRASLRVGIPFAFSALITVVFGLLDKAVIARTQPLSELAVYSLSYDITTKGWMFVWAINGAILPILMRWGHAREEDKIAKAFEYSWWAVAAVVIAIYLPLNLFEQPLLGWWVGLKMARDARYYIGIFSLSSLFYFVVCVFYNFFQASGRTKEIARAYVIGLVFYLLGVMAGVVSGSMLVMATAHVALWTAVALSMSVMYARELRGRRAAL